MSGGDQKQGESFQNSSTNSTSTSDPNPVVQPILKRGVGFLDDYFAKNPNAPSLFPGSYTAAPSVATQSANQTYRDIATSGLGWGIDPASRQNVADTLGGKFLDPGANPYLQKYLRAGFDVQNEEFNNSVMPNLRTQFAGAGRTGSGADFNVAMRGADALARGQADAAAKAEAGAYSDERGRQMQAQGLLPSLQGMDMARAGALARSGQGIDAYEQRLRDEQIFRDTYGKTADLDYWLNIAQRGLGMYPGGQTNASGSSSGSSYEMGGGGGGFGSFLGPMMSLGGGAMSMFGGGGMGGMFSDESAKTDIEELGTDPLTGLPMYAYRYKSDPKHYPKVVGPMAQDIEARGGPVREINGHKVVGGLF